MRITRNRWLLIASALLLLLYFGSYVVLSRRGYADAERWNMKGFYYFFPEDSREWRVKNYGCMYLFKPLNLMDQWLGLGKPPAAEPLWGLSK